jgi:hypothetical protein
MFNAGLALALVALSTPSFALEMKCTDPNDGMTWRIVETDAGLTATYISQANGHGTIDFTVPRTSLTRVNDGYRFFSVGMVVTGDAFLDGTLLVADWGLSQFSWGSYQQHTFRMREVACQRAD